MLLVDEVELETELFGGSGKFVVLLVVEVESEVELLVYSDIFVVLFDNESELVVELLDVLSLDDMIDGADMLLDGFSPPLQAVAERHIKTADNAAIILFIFNLFPLNYSKASEILSKSVRIGSFCGQRFSHLPHFTQSAALPCSSVRLP